MKVWKMQVVLKDPDTSAVLARAMSVDPKTGEQKPAYKYAKEEAAKGWIASVRACSKRTEIVDGEPVEVIDAIEVIDKNHEVPDDLRGDRFQGGHRFTRKALHPANPPKEAATAKG